MVVEIIQSNLTPGYDLGSFRQLRHLFEITLASELCFVGMNADRRVNESVFFGESDGAVERPRASSTADSQNCVDPTFTCACDHLLAVSIELLRLEMCVGIDEHGFRLMASGSPNLCVRTGLGPRAG